MAITLSGICPLNFSNFNPPRFGAGDGSVKTTFFSSPNILDQVPSPTMPSAVNPFDDCQPFTAISVPAPKTPSGFNPNFDCNFFTSSPVEPFFNNIVFFNYKYPVSFFCVFISKKKS